MRSALPDMRSVRIVLQMLMVRMVSMCSMSSVVAAIGAVGIHETTSNKVMDGKIDRTKYAGINRNPYRCECHSCTLAETAADKGIHIFSPKEMGKTFVSRAQGVQHPFLHDLSVMDLIDHEMLRMAEMLKYMTVFKGYCYAHGRIPPLICWSEYA